MTERRPKYGNKKCEYGGRTFESRAEMRRYQELVIAQGAGEIADLKCQTPFLIEVNGQRICIYRADFTYSDCRTGALVVEDVKSPATRTRVYMLKKKLLAATHGIQIAEVSA